MVHATALVHRAVHDQNAMTPTSKNSPELASPGKSGASSQNAENNAGQSPRSNPVCLEVIVTIRSLPNEAGGLAQPIREEGRTVIVFDNGAVLRSTIQMPVGLTVILSNPKGCDVVCRVVGGRNLPTVKGYVEVEFIEPTNDFWNIHQDLDPVAFTPPPVVLQAPQVAAVQPIPTPTLSPGVAAPVEVPATTPNFSMRKTAAFEEFAGPTTMPPSLPARDSKIEPARPGREMVSSASSDYNLSEIAKPTSLAGWHSPSPEQAAEKPVKPAAKESLSMASPSSISQRDFMSKGLMAYEQPSSSNGVSNGRLPLIVGVISLILAGVCAMVFFAHRQTAPVSETKASVESQPSAPQPPSSPTATETAQAPQDDTAQSATQLQAQPVALDQPQPLAVPTPVPAVVTGPATTDPRTVSRNSRRQGKNEVVAKQTDLPSPRRPAIPNLKIGLPSAPNQNLVSPGDGTAPITDVAVGATVGGTPPAGLLTSAGRTSNPPTPPPAALGPAPAPAPAVKTVRDPKLITSGRPAYPAVARQENVQGSVTVSANIDVNGNVVAAKALSGPVLLRQAAEGSVRLWKYSPALADGKPVPSQVTVSVDFRLN